MTLASYPRLPNLLIIGCALLGSIAIGLAIDQASQGKLSDLEQQIAHSDDPALWQQYANALYKQQRFKHAAQAYKHLLELEPYHQQAQFQIALALAQEQAEGQLYAYMHELSYEHASLANELFARSELQDYLKQARFQQLAHEASVQAVD